MKDNDSAVIDGFYADPDLIFSEKDNCFYLYPTTDGKLNWQGTYFECFSSKDLIDWEKKGIILDLTKDVSWAIDKAWAPSAIEKKIDNEYHYFFYFCAEQKIGVATSTSPFSGFKDKGTPLITDKYRDPSIDTGQEIDPYVFHDKKNDSYYLFWGNMYLARAELNSDMVSIKEESIAYITPNDGSFREAVSVFYRKDRYYYIWSENDTRHPDYRLRYGYNFSIEDPLIIPKDNVVLEKYEALNILATGHCDVINKPNSDEFYLFYHQFSLQDGQLWNDESGYHRELQKKILCFDDDGAIKPINHSI
ncbi:family 43 glycosylhydrolase [Rosenbergiella epipactidis]|uniref:family 43 glycosylhydrolase n=1 Tax=Rosenbergiella epipactidis TaxID=1544694 RepID=UPI001F4D8B84